MRTLVALVFALLAGLVALTAGAGLTGSSHAAIVIAALGAALAGSIAWKRPIVDIDPTTCSRSLGIVSSLGTVLALVQLARLAVFLVDPSQPGYSTVPSSAWEVRHSCLSAYFVASEAAGRGHNPYDETLYNALDDDGTSIRKARTIGPFNVDVYEYPPPFLLLPRACMTLTPDFMRLRMLWFALSLAVLVVSIPIVARVIGPPAATRAVLLSPLILAALPTLSGLQKGNVQLMVIALSMLAMFLFERGRPAAGGALLAFTTVSKLFPALLVLYLIARRQWRAVAWTVGMGIAYVILTLLDLGWRALGDFLQHLPGLLGGQAFPAFRNPGAMAINFSVPGLVFKLKLFGVPGAGFVMARIVGTASTLVLVWAVIRAARSTPRDGDKPLVWISILILASLCSPFLPQAYAAFPPLWLLTLLAATYAPTRKTLGMIVLVWLGLCVYWPIDWPLDRRLLAVVTLLPQSLTIAIAVLGLRRGLRPPVSRA